MFPSTAQQTSSSHSQRKWVSSSPQEEIQERSTASGTVSGEGVILRQGRASLQTSYNGAPLFPAQVSHTAVSHQVSSGLWTQSQQSSVAAIHHVKQFTQCGTTHIIGHLTTCC